MRGSGFSRFGVAGFKCGVWGSRFGVSGAGFSRFDVLGFSRFWVSGFGCGVSGSRCSGFRGSGLKVMGARFWVSIFVVSS